MKAVFQRVTEASVTVNGNEIAAIDHGVLLLVGVCEGDTEQEAALLAKKVAELRVFCDENDKMNLSLKDVDGEALVVSNFTLLASYKKGKRPDYFGAAAPDEANRLYEYFCSLIDAEIKQVGRGVFGADMEITMVNDGPVTIVMDSNVLLKKKTIDGEVK